MEKGTIQKIFGYYFTKPQFREEMLKAIREFFNAPDLDVESESKSKLELEEGDEEKFNEWFIFDFRLRNGKIPLEDFCERNPYNFNQIRLQIYKDLQENFYGIYEILEIKTGKSLTLENIQTGKIYEVREFLGTFGIKEGEILFGRVGKIGDHYELVGSNSVKLPIEFAKNTKKMLRKTKDKFDPKIVRDLFSKKEESAEEEWESEKFSSFEEAEDNLVQNLKKYKLDKFVNAQTIKKWIYDVLEERDNSLGVNMLCGLVNPDMENYEEALEETADAYMSFYNFCPQRRLDSQSPFEKRKEMETRGEGPKLKFSSQEIAPIDWTQDYHKALHLMKKQEFKKALEKYNKVFDYLLEQKTTFSEIFRPFANKAMCHFALRQNYLGEKMLKISLSLNPNYDFGKLLLKRFQKGEFELIKKSEMKQIAKGILKTRSKIDSKEKQRREKLIDDIFRDKEDIESFSKDSGYKYYQFFQKYQINFAQPLNSLSNIETVKIKNRKPK